MSEFPESPNVSRLPSMRSPAPSVAEKHVLDEVSQLLAQADPVPAPREPEPQWLPAPTNPKPEPAAVLDPGPTPGHRNGIVCAQCDRWTWRATRECRHCGYDLFAHAHRFTQERQRQWREWRRQQLVRWGMWLLVGGIAAIYLSPKLGAPLDKVLTIGGIAALVGALLCGKLMPPEA